MAHFGCEEARRCLEEKAMGVVSGADAEALEVHLAICEDCRRAHQPWRTIEKVAREAPLDPLPPLVERRLLSGRRAGPPSALGAPAAARRGIAATVIAAAVVVALVWATQLLPDSAITDAREEPTPVAIVVEVSTPAMAQAPVLQSVPSSKRREIRGVSEGTALWIERGAVVRIARNDTEKAHFLVDEGFVVAAVGNNEPGFSFEVETPAARVIAHGTVFTVMVATDGAESYRVAEGVVEVIDKQDPTRMTIVEQGMETTLAAWSPAPSAEDDLAADLAWLKTPADGAAPLPAVATTPVVNTVPPLPDLAELTRLAQRQQMDRQPTEAYATYELLQRSYPGSEAAVVADITMGQMALGVMGDPDLALVHFDRYLTAAPEGLLAEEARFGHVRAQQELGRHDAVVAAADGFFVYHGSAVSAPQVLLIRARAHAELGDEAGAASDYQMLITAWPGTPQASQARATLTDDDRDP